MTGFSRSDIVALLFLFFGTNENVGQKTVRRQKVLVAV